MISSKTVKNIVLLGETGSGKSSLINLLTNYCRKQKDVSKLLISIPTPHHKATENFKSSEMNLNDSTKSKTSKCFVYPFDMGDFIFNIIDSPGLNDTNGHMQDDKNLELILKTISDLGEVDAIFIIINGSISRMTVNIQNLLVRIKGNLPDSVISSIGFILTNSWSCECNFDISVLTKFLKNDNENVFYMNNSAFSRPSKEISSDPKALRRIQGDYDECFEVIDNIMNYIEKVGSVASADFKKMNDSRNAIKAKTHQIKLEISNLIKILDEIVICETQLKNFANDENTFKNYTTTRIVSQVELVDANYHSTICSECNTVCHDHCGLHETTTVGDRVFTGCACMSNGRCKVCEKKCDYTTHYHARKTMKKTEKTMDDILHDVKAKYDAAVDGKNKTQTKVNTAKNSKVTTEAAIQQHSQSVLKECKNIKKLCSGFNFVDEVNILVKQMEMENAGITNLEARNKADDFIRSLKTLANALSQPSE